MQRRKFIQSSLLLGGSLCLPSTQGMALVSDHKDQNNKVSEKDRRLKPCPYAGQKPHVILIMTDQHRSDALKCMGNSAIISPNIDRLAGDGTLFTRGFSAVPSSTPARTGLLTGMTPYHHGMLGYGVVAEHYKYEMPAMLRELGYFCMGIGKMHWNPQSALHGFHGTLLDESGREESPYFKSDYRKWFQIQAPGENPDKTGLGWNDHGARPYALPEVLHPTSWTSREAREFIGNYELDKPLFLKISFARPHSPYDPPKRMLDLYKNINIPEPAIGDWCDAWAKKEDPSQVASDAPYGNFGSEYAKNTRKHYYASISFIDEQIGKIIESLKKKGMYENSIICFTADHGDMMGDHYHWRKTYPYQGSAGIPFIVKWPARHTLPLPTAGKCPKAVELMDFLPTFLELAGGTIPTDMDGLSLRKAALGEEWREYLCLEHARIYSNDNYWGAITNGRYKYIWNWSLGTDQFFDMDTDPLEKNNLIHSTEHQTKIQAMREAFAKAMSERGEQWVKDGKLLKLDQKILYSPAYPGPIPAEKKKSI